MLNILLNIFMNKELVFLMIPDLVRHKCCFNGGHIEIQDGRHKWKFSAWHPP